MGTSAATASLPAPRAALALSTGQWAALTTTATTGQWFSSERGTRWWFDSGSLALDLAHTGVVVPGGDPAVQALRPLAEAADLDAWLSGRVGCSPATDRDLADALVLRESLVRLVVAASREGVLPREDVDLLNLVAATPDVPPRLRGGSRQAGATLAPPRQALSSIARDGVAVLSGQAAGRVRSCDAEDCELVYLDTSRAGSRRWCSMDRCGNRSKVRAHRARLRLSRRPPAGGPRPRPAGPPRPRGAGRCRRPAR